MLLQQCLGGQDVPSRRRCLAHGLAPLAIFGLNAFHRSQGPPLFQGPVPKPLLQNLLARGLLWRLRHIPLHSVYLAFLSNQSRLIRHLLCPWVTTWNITDAQ